MVKEVIETPVGKLWVDLLDDGSMRIWWPYGARVGELAAEVARGRARWSPETHGWYVHSKHRDAVYEALQDL